MRKNEGQPNTYCNDQEQVQKPSVLVMMSTYNGEKYIREQIDSILSQRDVSVDLFIRDDCSSDGTRMILSEYENKDCINIEFGSENLGPGEGFMTLLYSCFEQVEQHDFYAFADQDDIWLPDKLYRAIEILCKLENPEGPLLYCSNQTLYKNNEKIGFRFSAQPDLSLIGHLNANQLSGCTYVMNKALVERICESEHAGKDIIARRIHDAWIMLCAIVCGKVIYDNESRILYRIHENNAVGIKKTSVAKRLNNKWKNLTNKRFGNIRQKTAEQLLRSFPDVSGRNRIILEEIAYYKKNWKNKKILLNDTEIVKNLDGAIPGWVKVLLNTV